MNIIIPCTGLGKRFISNGYSCHKSFLPVDNNDLVIDKVIKMFDPKDNFIIIANEFNYSELVNHFVRSNIHIILSYYEATGPVKSIINAKNKILDVLQDEGCIISYSDFYQTYDYLDFKEWIKNTNSDGCILSYTNYHPHFNVTNNKYASSKLDKDNNVLEIKEKHNFDSMEKSFHSSGMYYFKSFELIMKYFNILIDKNIHLNNEYYVSMVYNEMINDKLKITSYNKIHHFLQLGTPQDYEYFKSMEDKYLKLNSLYIKENNIRQIMLMAGRSERFINDGYDIPKPFLMVSDKKMHLIQDDYLNCYKRTYITADDYEEYVEKDIYDKYVFIEKNKIGPAYSYYKGAKHITGEVIITSCDVLANYFTKNFYDKIDESDVIIFATTNHKNSIENPNSYSWIKHDNEKVESVSLKKLLNNAKTDYMLIGSFYVKNNETFIHHLNSFLSIEKQNNEEYFIDEFMNYLLLFGYKINTVLVDGYYSFGTPKEYKESNYFLTYFDKESETNDRN